MATIETGTRRKTEAKKIWDDSTYQIIAILQETFHVGEVIMEPAKYVTKYKDQLEAAGPELAFLQLATPSKKSPFGWQPTPRLMEFVAKRKTAKKSKRLYEADIWYQLLTDYAFGYESDRGEGSVFTRELLLALGLLCEGGFGDCVTEDLHILFDNGYYAKRKRDGLPIMAELSPGPYHVVMS
jgi:hypothetical protein